MINSKTKNWDSYSLGLWVQGRLFLVTKENRRMTPEIPGASLHSFGHSAAAPKSQRGCPLKRGRSMVLLSVCRELVDRALFGRRHGMATARNLCINARHPYTTSMPLRLCVMFAVFDVSQVKS